MYQPLDDTKPDGAHAPPVYGDEDLANVRALRDGIVSGFVPGWAFAFATVAGVSDTYTWSKGVFRLRATVAYTAGLISSVTWEWSEDSGGSYANINTGGAAVAVTSNAQGIITAMANDAAAWILAISAMQRASKGGGDIAAHAALVGPAAHGLGTLSTQNANAVALTGGTAQAIAATLLTRLSPAAPPTLVTATPLDWAARPTQVEIAAGATINGFTNAQPGEMKRILVVGAGLITINAGAGNTLTWGVGHPVFGATFTIINVIARSATQFLASSVPF